MAIFIDVQPLRESRDFRRLLFGSVAGGLGAHLAATAIGLQVFALTGSSLSVGLVGLFALVPTVIIGLYGGVLTDVYDRRKVALVGSSIAWVAAFGNLTQAALGNTHTWVLYALTSLHFVGFGILSPARSAIYPRLLPARLLPAANALNGLSMSATLMVGAVVAGFMVATVGYTWTYAFDAFLYTFAFYSLLRLPSIIPEPDNPSDPATTGRKRVPGLRSVADGMKFLATRGNLLMTFLTDFCAMILAFPRALLPAIAIGVLAGDESYNGILLGALSFGSILAMLLSGSFGQVRRQGQATVVAVACWGASIATLGLVLVNVNVLGTTTALILSCLALACAGASDSISMVFRTTILQSATPDRMRGRLQGVFIVVVAGGPRLGELVSGTVAEFLTEPVTVLVGGLACLISVITITVIQKRFWHYDALHPQP